MNRCMEMLKTTVPLMPRDINYVSEYECILMRIFGAFRQSSLKTPRSKKCCFWRMHFNHMALLSDLLIVGLLGCWLPILQLILELHFFTPLWLVVKITHNISIRQWFLHAERLLLDFTVRRCWLWYVKFMKKFKREFLQVIGASIDVLVWLKLVTGSSNREWTHVHVTPLDYATLYIVIGICLVPRRYRLDLAYDPMWSYNPILDRSKRDPFHTRTWGENY
jgi:hypothetical protein